MIAKNGKEVMSVYKNGKLLNSVWVGNKQVWPNRYRYAAWLELQNPILSAYDPDREINRYGAYVYFPGNMSLIYRVAFCYTMGKSGEAPLRFTYVSMRDFASIGDKYVYVIPFVAYNGKVVADGLTSDMISTIPLDEKKSGDKVFYSVTARANLQDSNGKFIYDYSGVSKTENCMVFQRVEDARDYVLGKGSDT